MTIGVCGPVDLTQLDWELKGTDFPETNAFPLTSHFINALLKRGFKVIAYTNSGTIDKPIIYEGKQLKVCIGRQLPKPGRRFFKFEVNELQELIEAHPCDIISAFWSYEFGWAALRTGIPTVVSLHDVALQILLNHMDIFRLVRWAMNYIVVTKAQHIIANSAYTYHQLDAGTRKKARVINNFFTDDLERQLRVPAQKENYIVSVVMGFSRRKNIKTSLRAFAKIRQKFPTLEYHLLGAEMEENGLAQQFARKHGLEEGVKFLGALPFDQVMGKIAAAKLLIHPAREESFGMVLLEAMVAKTPVIGGHKSGYVPHLLNYGKAGLLCNILSPDDIAHTVIKLLSDEQLRDKLVQSAYDFAYSNYSEDVIIDRHLAYYAEVLGKPLTPTFARKKHEKQTLYEAVDARAEKA
jgi:glycosyltransferase involved in cell wall biosynthesis